MTTVVFSVFLAVVIFVAMGVSKHKESGQVAWRLNKKQLLMVLPLFLIVTQFWVVVPANTVGIQWSPFGGVREQTLGEGFQMKSPVDQIYFISTEVQSATLPSITGQTRDSQYITMNIDVKYKVNPSSAFQVFQQFRTLDRVMSDLIAPTVQRAIETVSTKYNVIEVLGEYRNEMYQGIEQELTDRLAVYGITFVSINFNDTDAGSAIEQAIQAEAVAKKAVETAQQELLRVETEAQQVVVQAQAEQDKARIEAETQIIRATAEAEANALIAASLSEAVLNKLYIENWDGKMPAVLGENGVMLDVSGLMD